MLGTGFLRNLAMLLGGTAAGQIIALAAAPVLTRIYSASDFAVVSAFVGISTILSIVATLRYDLALLLPKDDEDAGVVLQLAAWVVVFAGILIGVGLWLFGPTLAAHVPTFAAVAPVMGWVPLMVVAVSCFQILNAWGNRARAYRSMAGAGVLNQGGNVAAAIAIGVSRVASHGMVIGRLIGQVVAALWFVVSLWSLRPRRVANWASLKRVAQRYRQFPMFNVPYSVLGAFSQEFLVFALLAFHQAEVAGAFALVRTVLLMPSRYLSSSLGLVFFREAAQLFGTPALETLTLKLMRRLGIAVMPLTVFFMFWSEELFVLVFGNQWHAAGRMAAYYAPVAFLFLFTSWPERLYEVSERQRVSLSIEVFGNVAKVCAVLTPLYAGWGATAAIIGYAIADAVYHIVYLLGLFHVGRFKYSNLALIAGRIAIHGGIATVICAVLHAVPISPLLQAAVALFAVLVQIGCSIMLDLGRLPRK